MRIITWVKLHKRLVALSSAAIIFIAGGVGAYILLNLPPNPQTTLHKGIAAMYKADSTATRASVKYVTKDGFAMTVHIIGASNAGHSHYQARFSIHTGLVDINATGQVFQNHQDGDIYIRLGKNPVLAPFLQDALGVEESKLAKALEEMSGKWVRMSRFDITEHTALLGAWNCVLEMNKARLSSDDEPAFLAALQRYPYVKATQELEGGTVLGEPSRRYTVELDYTHEKSLYEATNALPSFTAAATECKNVDIFTTLIKQPGGAPHPLARAATEVWIGKNNGNITKMVATSDTPGYNTTITIENLYKPVTLTAPANYILFERIRDLLVPGSMEESYQYEFDESYPPEDDHAH